MFGLYPQPEVDRKMTHVAPLLPVLACVAMMFGAGAIAWIATRTPLRRVPWLARRARQSQQPAREPRHPSRA
jgi:hypothetical protein